MVKRFSQPIEIYFYIVFPIILLALLFLIGIVSASDISIIYERAKSFHKALVIFAFIIPFIIILHYVAVKIIGFIACKFVGTSQTTKQLFSANELKKVLVSLLFIIVSLAIVTVTINFVVYILSQRSAEDVANASNALMQWDYALFMNTNIQKLSAIPYVDALLVNTYTSMSFLLSIADKRT